MEKTWAFKNTVNALNGVVQLAGRCPAKPTVAGLIPGQGTNQGFRFSPWLGVHMRGN